MAVQQNKCIHAHKHQAYGLLHLHWKTVGLQAAEERHIVAVRGCARRDHSRRQLLRVADQVHLRCMQVDKL